MLNNKTLALGAAFAAGLSLSTAALAKDAQFGATSMQAGYQLASKDAEGKCGGEGKCGAKKEDKKEEKKEGEGKCGANMKKDGEGKCGADKKDAK
ncbi:MAG: hypothetical protein U1F46_00335 [Marinagarivorans sp.]|jgi:uncharacterized low-complexity protein